MGMTFSNIHLRKNEYCSKESVEKYFVQRMDLDGYKNVENFDDADYVLLLETTPNSDWITIDSNYFNLDTIDNMQNELKNLSEKFSTDVISVSCVASDFLMMNWINSKENYDAWLNIGIPYGGSYIRKTTLFLWKKKIKNYFAFLINCFKPHVFAEEAWYKIVELINMDMEQCIVDSRYYIEYPDRDENKKIYALFFRGKYRG